MIEIESHVKKWGNSLGVIIPKEIAARIKLKPELRIKFIVIASHSTRVVDVFGQFRFKKSTARILKDADKSLDINR